MDLEFKPPNGADLLPFGTERAEVRDVILGGRSFRLPPNEPENDMYESEGLILGYDKKDELEFIEVILPSKCHFSGVKLIGRPLNEVLIDMNQIGYQSEFEDESHNFTQLGIMLYCPQGVIGSASTYTFGYFDDI